MSFIPISFPTLKRRRPEKNKYVIYRARSVRMGKNCALGLEYGPRPSASGRTQDLGHSFFPIRTSRPVNNIYFLRFSSTIFNIQYSPSTPELEERLAGPINVTFASTGADVTDLEEAEVDI